MKIIKIPVLFFISISPFGGVVADSSVLSSESLYRSDILTSDNDRSIGFIGRYDVGLSIKERDQKMSYDLFDDFDVGNAWVGVAGGQSQLRAGRHDSVDSMATVDANQHEVDGAYDLVMRGDEILPNTLTYIKKTGPFAVGAQYAEGDSESDKESLGVVVNTQTGSYEAAIAYRRTPENNNTLKGRVTYKSRNNSKVRVDVVAEKFAVGNTDNDGAEANSTSFMVGAKYKMTPKSYVVGQYGAIGFEREGLSTDEGDLNRDYKALSFEAGYKLSDSTSIYVNHTQKNYHSSAFLMPFVDDDDGSQINSIGVRLNW